MRSAAVPCRFRLRLFPAGGLVLVLAACGAVPQRAEHPPRNEAGAAKAVRPGGYYLDDGPLDVDPAALDKVPDAIPRIEPIKASTARPYSVFGQTYTPMSTLAPYKASGVASWYGKRYHGQPTASGETYDMFGMTAAHPTLPIPSYVRVTYRRTGRSVIVRINDRGPFHSDRLIDLSYTAAYKLGMLPRGSGVVEVESLLPPFDTVALRGMDAGGTGIIRTSMPVAPAAADSLAPGIYLQLGAFSQSDNAQAFRARLESELGWLRANTSVVREAGVFRVQAGPFADQKQANQAAERIRASLHFEPMIVTR